MALYRRIWVGVCAVTSVVLALFVFLAVLQFDRIHSRLIGERLIVLANSASEPLAAAARLGLPIQAVRNADGLLERVRQTDDQITAIHFVDTGGNIVHSTERHPELLVPAEAARARETARGAPWSVRTSGGFLGGIDIVGRDGRIAGGVVVEYPPAPNATRVEAMAAELMVAAIVVLLLTASLGAVLLRLGLRRQIAVFETIDRVIDDFEQEAWRTAAGAEPARPQLGEGAALRALLDQAEARYRDVGRALGSTGR